MKNMNKICVIPWIHLEIDPDGDVFPCCMTMPHKKTAGNVNLQPLKSIWNSDLIKDMRLKMLAGEEPEVCSSCFNSERAGVPSVRTHKNKHFANDIPTLAERTNPDGSVDEVTLKYWDFRFSNVCNFKCRSCGPRHSTSWIPDVKAIYPAAKIPKRFDVKHIDLYPVNEFVDKNIDIVEEIYFAGGEPLHMDIHWYILDKLVELKKTNVMVGYNTNLSTLEYKGQNAVDYWKHFDPFRVNIWPSIDEIGERAEFVRSGTKWDDIDRNLDTILGLENVHVKPSITVSCLNVFRVTNILDYFESKGIPAVNINIAYHSSMMITTLPADYRFDIAYNLRKWIDHHPNIDVVGIQQLYGELAKPQNTDAVPHFIHFMKKLDNVRKENTYQAIPELKCLL